MRRIILVCIILITTAFAYSEELKFRNLSFGLSPEDVIAQEGQPDKIREENVKGSDYTLLEYSNNSVAGYDVAMTFAFTDREFFNSTYLIKLGNPKDAYECFDVYYDLCNKLDRVYGKSSWSALPDLKPGTIELTEEVLRGKPSFYTTTWEIEDDTISVTAHYSSHSSEWQVSITYMSQKRALTFRQGKIDTDGL